MAVCDKKDHNDNNNDNKTVNKHPRFRGTVSQTLFQCSVEEEISSPDLWGGLSLGHQQGMEQSMMGRVPQRREMPQSRNLKAP